MCGRYGVGILPITLVCCTSVLDFFVSVLELSLNIERPSPPLPCPNLVSAELYSTFRIYLQDRAILAMNKIELKIIKFLCALSSIGATRNYYAL